MASPNSSPRSFPLLPKGKETVSVSFTANFIGGLPDSNQFWHRKVERTSEIVCLWLLLLLLLLFFFLHETTSLA